MNQYKPIFSSVLSSLEENGRELAMSFSYLIDQFNAASASVSKLESKNNQTTFRGLLMDADAFISATMYRSSSLFRNEFERIFAGNKVDKRKLAELRAIALELKKSKNNED